MESTETLSLERKLRMYEAREAVLSRIGGETISAINLNLDRFLQATVTEVGKMMEVDRCDVMTLEGGVAAHNARVPARLRLRRAAVFIEPAKCLST